MNSLVPRFRAFLVSTLFCLFLPVSFSFCFSFSSLFAATAFPFATKGRSIIDAKGEPVHLKAVNWYGANLEAEVVQGLDRKSLQEIVRLIKDQGFNAVRLPFSNAMLHNPSPVALDAIAANPQLIGKTALQIFDATVEALAREDLAIMLNDHSTSSLWCCGYDTDGLWHYTGSQSGRAQTEDEWIQDWVMLAKRYEHLPQVMAADLRNEVRTAKWGDSILPLSPTWGKGDANDWARAAEHAGNEILKVRPDLLIIVEGINWTGTLGFLGGFRPHLTGVRDRPIALGVANRLVYAAHNYGYIGPKHNGDDKTSAGQETYSDMSEEEFFQKITEEWGFLLEPSQFFTAPLIVSEFGIGHDNPSEKDRVWFERLVRYMTGRNIHFAYWALNPDSYGLVDENWSSRNDWRAASLRELTQIPAGPRDDGRKFASFGIAQGDQQLSTEWGDWSPGASKGSCAAGMRLMGVSQDHRGLCSDSKAQPPAVGNIQLIDDQRGELSSDDWAQGFSKYSCPDNSYALGFAKKFWGSSGLLCMTASVSLSKQCRTSWFDKGDARAETLGGDFARASFKGQCAAEEYIAGLATRNGKASAIRCCAL